MRYFQLLKHHFQCRRKEKKSDNTYLAVDSREQVFVLGKLIHEDHSDLDDKIDESRVWHQINNISVLTNAMLDSVVEAFEQRALRSPTIGKKPLLLPCIQKGRESSVSEIVVDSGDNTVSAEERVGFFK